MSLTTMPSHLTRNVFRRILANQPIVHRGCLHRQARRSVSCNARTLRPLVSCNAFPIVHSAQRRGFFNFNIFSKRQEAKEADIDPGIEKMMELAKRERMRARLPPPEEISDALRRFFDIKRRRKRWHGEAITDTQAQLALQSLRYLITCQAQRDQEVDQGSRQPTLLPKRTLYYAAKVLRLESEPTSASHVELASLIYNYEENYGRYHQAFVTYVYTLCETGATQAAREVVLKYEEALQLGKATHRSSAINSEPIEEAEEEEAIEDGEQDELSDTPIRRKSAALPNAWPLVLRGFALEDNETEVSRTLAMIRERGLDDSRKVSSIMLDFNLKHGDLTSVTEWWKIYQHQNLQASAEEYKVIGLYLDKVLKWCLQRNELETGHRIVRELMTSNPPKPLWDAILIWAAGTKKSVDEIDRMMTVMEKSNANIQDRSRWRLPDIATINGLVEFAISKNDPYMAERFIALGRDRDIEPDAKTLVLQMDYRLSVNDVDGALVAYKNLQSKDLSSNEDVLTVNRLIVALCQTNRHDFDTIMNVAADLSDRHVRFEPLTVSTLSILHLSRDERDDVVDLLNTHAFHYSSTERQSIRDAILAFSLNPKTSTSRAWQGYTILKEIFDETPRFERTELMTSFLNRERSDMGVHVFQNMRMHSRADTIPTIDTYVAAFMGLAKLRDVEGLEVVHNLLKLDYNINTTTYLYNALMIAYTACGKPRAALDFWDDIVASREGPSYNSIHAALRACEKAPWGDLRAQQIWAILRKRNVDLDQPLWASYVAALAGNGDTQLAIGTLEEAEGKGEVVVDSFVLGSLFAGAAGQIKQAEVEGWGRAGYPEEWARLEALGVDADENGMRGFRIDRKVGP